MKSLINLLLMGACVLSYQASAAPGDDHDGAYLPNRAIRPPQEFPFPVTGLVYNIRNRASENVLDSDGHKVYYNSAGQGNQYQQWVLLETPVAYHCTIQHIQSRGRLLGEGDVVYVQPQAAVRGEGHEHRWTIEKAPAGPFFNIQNRRTPKWLENRSGRTTLGEEGGRANNPQRWNFVPAHYELRGVMRDFRLEADVVRLLDQHKGPITAAVVSRVRNQAAATREMGVDITERVRDKYCLDFTRSDEVNMSANFTVEAEAAGILGVFAVRGRAETNFNWSRRQFTEEHYHREHEEETTFCYQDKVTVPPYQSVEVKTLVTGVKGMQVPFSAVMDIRGYADRLRSDGKTVAELAPVGLEGLRYLMWYDGYKGRVIGQRDNTFQVRVTGTLTVNKGIIIDTLSKDIKE